MLQIRNADFINETSVTQSIYVTCADVQTIAQASVYYLIGFISMSSENSLYFIPTSVVADNGRYTKMTFTTEFRNSFPNPPADPLLGEIIFWRSAAGYFDVFPMGFYKYEIYEQTSSTNLDPTLATGLLEEGTAYVRAYDGNMEELQYGFNEYNPTTSQYVYTPDPSEL